MRYVHTAHHQSLPYNEIFLRRFSSPTITPKLASVSTPELPSTSRHVDRPTMRDGSSAEVVEDEQARIQVMRGRLDALRTILTQLSSVLDSVNDTHTYLAGQVNDLEMYVAGLAPPTDTQLGLDDSTAAATQMKTAQRRGQNKSNFWSKLNLNRVSLRCQCGDFLRHSWISFAVMADVLQLQLPQPILTVCPPIIPSCPMFDTFECSVLSLLCTCYARFATFPCFH